MATKPEKEKATKLHTSFKPENDTDLAKTDPAEGFSPGKDRTARTNATKSEKRLEIAKSNADAPQEKIQDLIVTLYDRKNAKIPSTHTDNDTPKLESYNVSTRDVFDREEQIKVDLNAPASEDVTEGKSVKEEYLHPAWLKVTIMNTSGQNEGDGKDFAKRRRDVIQAVILKESPNILLCQEFKWVGITGRAWKHSQIPEKYMHKGHKEACIIYDKTVMEVQDFPATAIDDLLKALQRSPNNRLEKPFPLDFTPVPRMCITQVTSSESTFIVISWHGINNKIEESSMKEKEKGRMKDEKKEEYFKYLMEFLRMVKEKFKLPIIIGGDFNVTMERIEKYVQSPFKLCKYDASPRRTKNGIVDFFIVTKEIAYGPIYWCDIQEDTQVKDADKILDHDPVSAVMRIAPV